MKQNQWLEVFLENQISLQNWQRRKEKIFKIFIYFLYMIHYCKKKMIWENILIYSKKFLIEVNLKFQ